MNTETAKPAITLKLLWNKHLCIVTVALAMFGWAGWYFGVELPTRREAVAQVALAKERAVKSLTIFDFHLDMVLIEPGTFLMGTQEQNVMGKLFYAAQEKITGKLNSKYIRFSDTQVKDMTEDERPVTWVTLTQPFWLGRTQVTQRQYEQVMGTDPSMVKDPSGSAPVEQVSWNDAMTFCQKLTERERVTGHVPVGYAYTLPTEAQWEYACRAGRTGDYLNDLNAVASGLGKSGGKFYPGGTREPNPWGLFNMDGSMAEWCKDRYADKLPGGEVFNPTGPISGLERVFRGTTSGTFVMEPYRYSSRDHTTPDYRLFFVGFRLALSEITLEDRHNATTYSVSGYVPTWTDLP